MDFLEKMKQLTEIELAILAVAKKEFEDRGYHQATVDRIAAELKIGKGTIYRHFGKKPMLYSAVMIYQINRTKLRMQSVYEKSDPHEAMMEYIDAMSLSISEIGKFFSQMSPEIEAVHFKKEMRQNKNLKAVFHFFFQQRKEALDLMMSIIDRGRSEGLITSSSNPEILAELCFSLINQFITFRYLGFGSDKISYGEGIRELKNFILKAIGWKYE